MQEETTSLDDLLANEGPQEEVQEEVQREEQPEGRSRDERGRFASKGVEDDGPPPSDKLPPEEFAGLKDERRKRQEAEQRLATLEQELQALKNPPAPPPSVFEDEQGWQQHFGTQVMSAAVQQASLNSSLNMSEMLARREHQDFDQMKATFLELAAQNPSLREEALADPDPWNKAYKIAKNHATMKELGAVDIEGLKEQLRKELMAEQGQAPGRPQLPPTLATERNNGTRSGPAWSGPTPLSELLR